MQMYLCGHTLSSLQTRHKTEQTYQYCKPVGENSSCIKVLIYRRDLSHRAVHYTYFPMLLHKLKLKYKLHNVLSDEGTTCETIL